MSHTKLQTWIINRKASGQREPFLYVNPADNVLVGMKAILSYLGIRSSVTLYQWVELYGLPAIKRPDGLWMTTMTSIDQWIFLAAEMDNENRPHSRGSNARYQIARRRLDARINEANLRRARGEEPVAPSGPKASWDKQRQGPPDQGGEDQ